MTIFIDVDATIERIGGFSSSGLVYRSYEEDVSGTFRVISKGHLYNQTLGIDIYPTKEQWADIITNKPIRKVRFA